MSKKKFCPSFRPSVFPSQRIVHLFLLFSAPLIPLYLIYNSFNQNGMFGLPFDDVFIHLTFAKNLYEYHAFSFFKNEMVTSGSSSPLYTIILAAGFVLTNDEFLLCYIFGLLIFILSAYFFYKINLIEYKSNYKYLLASVLIFVMDKKLIFFSISGMETILFVMILMAALYFYRTSNAIPFAFSLALSVWIRLEGIFFLIAVLTEYCIYFFFPLRNCKTAAGKFTAKEVKTIFSIFSVSIFLYFVFNLILSGTVLTNTFYAKKTFYSPEFMSSLFFLKNDIWEYFTSGSYSLLFTGFTISFLRLVQNLLKRKYNNNLLHFLFILIFVSAYYFEMPYGGLNGRYFVPLIPFYLMVSFSGFVFLFNRLKKFYQTRLYINQLGYFTLLAFIYLGSNDLNSEIKLYSKECKENQSKHIDAANWIKRNTFPGDLIATHEIGAIGFYSGRKIIDIAGLVTPDLSEKISAEDYVFYMQKYLNERGVKYFATMTNWCRVANSNPLFTSGYDKHASGIFEIFKYVPDTTHILSKEVSKYVTFAQYNLINNNPLQALHFLNQANRLDSVTSFVYFLYAQSYLKIGNIAYAETNLLRATQLFPEYAAANLALSNLYKNKKDYAGSQKYLDHYNQILNDTGGPELSISEVNRNQY